MMELVKLDPLGAWRLRIDVTEVLNGIEDLRVRDRALRRLQVAADASHKGYPKLIERHNGEWRIRARPPLLMPLSGQADDTHELAARAAFELLQAQPAGGASGAGGPLHAGRCRVQGGGRRQRRHVLRHRLLATPRRRPLLLQLKEASASVLAPYAGPSLYANQGQRVVVGQRHHADHA